MSIMDEILIPWFFSLGWSWWRKRVAGLVAALPLVVLVLAVLVVNDCCSRALFNVVSFGVGSFHAK